MIAAAIPITKYQYVSKLSNGVQSFATQRINAAVDNFTNEMSYHSMLLIRFVAQAVSGIDITSVPGRGLGYLKVREKTLK
jgi:hypothetical protein